MQCVEPSAAACELARISCQGTDTVTVTNTTFEAFELGDRTFDAVLAATSFHWVSPDIACPKSAAALKPGGALILLWATPPLCAALQPVYDQHGLSELGQQQWRSQAYYQTNFEQFATTISQSGFFEPTQVTIQQQRSPYTLEKYLALLSTLSDYIALPASQQEQLMSDLSHALHQHIAQQDNGPDMQLTHWFGHQVSPKASP